MINLCISNIAWSSENDTEMYHFLKDHGIKGLEIAPTRIFPIEPYNHLQEAEDWSKHLFKEYSLTIPSMQSIWYGHTEKIFNSKKERKILIEYTKQAIDFADRIGCKNLVFGNPKNRDTEDITKNIKIAIDFFHEIGEYANEHNTVIALEANPTIYNTHFMNYTNQAVKIAKLSCSKGIKVNVDLGTIICNNENINYLETITDYINHIHISEPNLNIIEPRLLHKQLFQILQTINYSKFVSVEMANKNNIDSVKNVLLYLLDYLV